MNVTISKQRYYDCSSLYIGFDLNIENYMILDKASTMGGMDEIVTPKNPDNGKEATAGIAEFSKMYLINNMSTPEMKNNLKNGATVNLTKY